MFTRKRREIKWFSYLVHIWNSNLLGKIAEEKNHSLFPLEIKEWSC